MQEIVDSEEVEWEKSGKKREREILEIEVVVAVKWAVGRQYKDGVEGMINLIAIITILICKNYYNLYLIDG